MTEQHPAASGPQALFPQPRFRFRLIRAWTALLYILAGVFLLWLPPQDNLAKAFIALGFIGYGGLRWSNHILPWGITSGVWLYEGGFGLRRPPFGWHRSTHGYCGFLRAFALPSQGLLLLVFDRQLYRGNPSSSLARQLNPSGEPSTPHKHFAILEMPMPRQPQRFVETLLAAVKHDRTYQETKPQLTDIDPQAALTAYVEQRKRQSLIARLQQRLRTAWTILRWMVGYNHFPEQSPTSSVNYFRFPDEDTRGAWGLFIGLSLVAVGTGVMGSIQSNGAATVWLSISLLAVVTLAGPLAWLLLNAFRQQSGVVITRTACILRQPLRFFDRDVPLRDIGGVAIVNIDQIAIIWLKQRRTAPGEAERPPRPRLLLSNSIENVDECLTQIHHPGSKDQLTWSAGDIRQRKQRRALWRRLLLFLALPPFAFILMLVTYRIAFAVLAF